MSIFNPCCTPADRWPRAVGRLAFGTGMLAGTAILLHRLFTVQEAMVGRVIVLTWLLSAVAGWIAHQLAHEFPGGSRIFVLSYAVPTLGLASLLPLSIHLAGAHALGFAADFDTYVRASLFWVGAAHVAFAILATKRAAQLAQGRVAISTRRVFAITLVVSCSPGVLILMPPVLVGVTCLVLVPLLDRMERVIARERDVGFLPMVIVV